MARKKTNKKDKKAKNEEIIEEKIPSNVDPEKVKNVVLVVLMLFIIISVLSLCGIAGQFGDAFEGVLEYIFGFGKYFFPIVLLFLFVFYLTKKSVNKSTAFGSVLVFFSLLAFFDLFNVLDNFNYGGIVGKYFLFPFYKLTGPIASFFIMFAIFLIGAVIAFNININDVLLKFYNLIKSLFRKNKEENIEAGQALQNQYLNNEINNGDNFENKKTYSPLNSITPNYRVENNINAVVDNKKKSDVPSGGDINTSVAMKKLHVPKKELYIPIDLLEQRQGSANAGDVDANTMIIQKTLGNFGINVMMDSVKVGPSVTQYAFKPQEGIKLSRISALQDDLALALAANSLRMEAPIPGKSLVGIEVPNKVGAVVSMKEMIDSEEFRNRKSNLSLLLGKDVSGKPYIADLAKMPHLLIAGATGTGKSVCIHGVIASLMFQNSPDELKFIMVDPKRVEMTLYNGIPYLLTPPVTDPRKIVNALKWAVSEMDRRYQILAEAKKINLTSYNESVSEDQKMPYIVIVIDELADLMMLSRNEVEPCIIRIAQLARAVGIHLILATQRPSVNVITGLIKANVPARIAFSVASSIDSRTVLDETGAEKLIGKGDMLYSAADTPKPVRIQGAYMSDDEIRKVVLHLKTLDYEVNYDDSIVEKKSLMTNGGVTASGFNADDDLFEEVVAEVMRSKKASTSLLQRKFSIGYARAARLMDLLEEAGMIGPANGAKPREVYITDPAESTSDSEENVEKTNENESFDNINDNNDNQLI